MEEEKKPFYRYCMVPMCPNNIKSTPDKVFFAVPRDPNIRKQWCEVMRREYNVSSISRLHCCEDHFNVSIIFGQITSCSVLEIHRLQNFI